MEYFCCFGRVVTNGKRCKIKTRIAMAKAAFSEEKNLFTSKLYLNLRKKLVKYRIWGTALCGAVKLRHFGKIYHRPRKVLKYDAGEGWKYAGPIV